MLSEDDIRELVELMRTGEMTCSDITGLGYRHIIILFSDDIQTERFYELWRLLEQDSLVSYLSEEEFRRRAISESSNIEQILGKSLGYDKLYPYASQVDDGQVDVGEHNAETLAQEAANRITWLREKIESLEKEIRENCQQE